jgi:hypothetical protein
MLTDGREGRSVGSVGKVLAVTGIVLLAVGGVLMLLQRAGITSLPGDLSFRRGNARFYIPIGTSIVLSIVLTLLLNLFRR